MADAERPHNHWRWKILGETPKTKKPRWTEFRWHMTEADAQEWAAINGYTIPETMQKVPNSGEHRQGGYDLRVWWKDEA